MIREIILSIVTIILLIIVWLNIQDGEYMKSISIILLMFFVRFDSLVDLIESELKKKR